MQRRVIITDNNLKELAEPGFIISIPPGEKSKTREMKAWIEDQMLEAGFGRDSCILAFGGGVVTDLAGFVAATFCRGIPWIAMPTSLIGMIDASIGGKVGVNTPCGKNMVGAFYPPEEVIVNFDLLETLPEKEWKNGVAEVIKYGLIADPSILDNPRDPQTLERCMEIKRRVVEEDPKERGLRRILNFGHTVGHALEFLSNYEISHGEAVASGMYAASRLSHHLGHLSSDQLGKVEQCLEREGFVPHPIPQEALEVMQSDKKSLEGKPRFVLLEEMGRPLSFEGAYCTPIEPKILEEVLCK